MADNMIDRYESLVNKKFFQYKIEANTIVWNIYDFMNNDIKRQGLLFKEVGGCNFILIDFNVYHKLSIVEVVFKPKNVSIDYQSKLSFQLENKMIIELHNCEWLKLQNNKAILRYSITKEAIELLLNNHLESIYFHKHENSCVNYFESVMDVSFAKYVNIYKEILQATLGIYDKIPNNLDTVKVIKQELPIQELPLVTVCEHKVIDVKPEDEKCYVYLMFDTSNNYYKIGESKNPQYRERTLQSEKPCIELLCAKRYPNKTLARTIEQALHKTYKDKRIRGEWFDLTEKDVSEIKEVLQ